MIPPTSIDGTDITGATIDGQDVQEITVDGDTVFTAGLNGLYLDDFADDKLTNRDDFGTTPLNPSSLEPTTSAFSPATRPEWDVNGASVSNQQLQFGTGDSVIANMTKSAFTMSVDIISQSNQESYFQVGETDTLTGAFDERIMQDSYFFQFKQDNDLRFAKFDSNNNKTFFFFNEISWSDGDTVTYTYDGNGTHDILVNGVSQGTVTNETEYTNFQFVSIAQRNRGSSSTFDNFRVF